MRNMTKQELLDRILQAEADELNEVMDALTERFTEVWPEYELMIMSVHGHTAEAHLQALDRARTIYEGLKQRGHE